MGLVGRTSGSGPARIKNVRQEFKARLWGSIGGHYEELAQLLQFIGNDGNGSAPSAGIWAYGGDKDNLKGVITREIMSVEYGLKSPGRGDNGIIMVVGSKGINIADLRRINTAKKRGRITILSISDVWSTASEEIHALKTITNIESLKGDQKTEACRRVLIKSTLNSSPLHTGSGPREGDWFPVVLVARSGSWVMRSVGQFLKAFDKAGIYEVICYGREKTVVGLRSIYDGDKMKEIPNIDLLDF